MFSMICQSPNHDHLQFGHGTLQECKSIDPYHLLGSLGWNVGNYKAMIVLGVVQEFAG